MRLSVREMFGGARTPVLYRSGRHGIITDTSAAGQTCSLRPVCTSMCMAWEVEGGSLSREGGEMEEGSQDN